MSVSNSFFEKTAAHLERQISEMSSLLQSVKSAAENGVEPSLLKWTSPLFGRLEMEGVLTSEFRLTDDEEILLLRMVDESKLAPHATLLDLFFFNLYQELTALSALVKPSDYDKAVATLEACYATILTKKEMQLDKLQQFLKSVVRDFIASNVARTTTATPELKVIAMGNTQHIIKTLNGKVSLFNKFLDCAAARAFFFTHPFSKLKGCESIAIQSSVILQPVFVNNALFLEKMADALIRNDPKLQGYKSDVIKVVEWIKSIDVSMESSPSFEADMMSCIVTTFALKEIMPAFCNMIEGSMPFYWDYFQRQVAIYAKHQTAEKELMLLTGQQDFAISLECESDDILAAFKAEKLIPQTFQLSASEAQLIRDLCSLYPLGSHLSMLDILGFAINDHLGQLIAKSPTQCKEQLIDAQADIAAACIRLLIGLRRSSNQYIHHFGPPNDFTGQFSLTIPKFLERLDDRLSSFKDSLMHVQSFNKNSSSSQQNKLKKIRQGIVDELDKMVIPMRDLLNKLLQAEDAFQLILIGMSYYQGGVALEQESDNARTCIQQYWNYIQQGHAQGIKKGWLGVRYPFGAVVTKGLNFSYPPKEVELAQFGKKVIQEFYSTKERLAQLTEELTLAKCDKLSHQEWLAKNGAACTTKKQQKEFFEQLCAVYLTHEALSMYLTDLIELVEKRICPKGTPVTRSLFYRLTFNLVKYAPPSQHLPTSKITNLAKQVAEKLQEHQPLFEMIRRDRQPTSEDASYLEWVSLLVPMGDELEALLIQSLQSLVLLKSELSQDLKSKWSKLSIEELKAVDVSAVRESLFQEGLQLVRPLVVLSDALAVLYRRSLRGEASAIPQELVEIMDLGGLEEIIQELILAKTVVVEKTPEPALPTISQQAPEKLVVIKKAVSKPAKKEVKPIAKVVQPIVAPSVDLTGLNKSRKILQRLKELGFWEDRQRGSHHILKGPQGGVVVVPENSSLQAGTVRSIQDQAAAALHKQG